jgi:hypothetical protein
MPHILRNSVHWYHSQTNLIWWVSPFNKFYYSLFYTYVPYLVNVVFVRDKKLTKLFINQQLDTPSMYIVHSILFPDRL